MFRPLHSYLPARSSRRLAVVGIALALVVLLATAAQACPTCRDSFGESGEAGQRLMRGYFWSILFMMSMPFAILGGVGGYMYREVRKARAAQPPQAAEHTPTPL